MSWKSNPDSRDRCIRVRLPAHRVPVLMPAPDPFASVDWYPGTCASIDDQGRFYDVGEDHASFQNSFDEAHGTKNGWVRVVSSPGYDEELGMYKMKGSFTDPQWAALTDAVNQSDDDTAVWIGCA